MQKIKNLDTNAEKDQDQTLKVDLETENTKEKIKKRGKLNTPKKINLVEIKKYIKKIHHHRKRMIKTRHIKKKFLKNKKI